MCYIGGVWSRLACVLLLAILPACDGIEDIPDDRIICCLNGERRFLIARIDCVYDPDGRVVAYEMCGDGGSTSDAAIADATISGRD